MLKLECSFVLTFRVMSKVVHDCISFALLRLVIGPEKALLFWPVCKTSSLIIIVSKCFPRLDF